MLRSIIDGTPFKIDLTDESCGGPKEVLCLACQGICSREHMMAFYVP